MFSTSLKKPNIKNHTFTYAVHERVFKNYNRRIMSIKYTNTPSSGKHDWGWILTRRDFKIATVFLKLKKIFCTNKAKDHNLFCA